MSDLNVRGTVHVIEPTKTYGQKGFRKRLVVLETENGNFTNYVPIDFVKDACDSVDELQLGDEIAVAFRLSGRKWQKDAHSEVKYFLSLEATKYEVVRKKAGGPPTGPADDGDPFLDESEPSADEVPF